MIGSLRRDEKPVGDLLRCESSCREAQHMILRPAGRFRLPVTGSREDGIGRAMLQYALRDEPAQFSLTICSLSSWARQP